MMTRFSLPLSVVAVFAVTVSPVFADALPRVAVPSSVVLASGAVSEKDAQAFIDKVAARGISFLSTNKGDMTEQRRKFRDLLRDSFDLSTIGRFAVGKYWRAASTAQRSEYQRLFEDLVVDTYAARFSNYKDQKLVVRGAKTVEGGDVMVTSQIVPADGSEKVNLDWRVRGTNGSFKVVDVVIEGVSMAVTQRSDFAGLIGQKNGDIGTLIDYLKNRKSDTTTR